MVTENGTIKAVTPMDEKMQKSISHKTYIIMFVCLIIGCVGLAVYLALATVWAFLDLKESDLFDILLIISAVLFAVGLIFVITIKKLIAKARESLKINTYEFYSDHVIITENSNGEQTATVKLYYNQITKGKENKLYLMFFINSVGAFPVLKENLSEGELNTLRKILKIRLKSGAVAVPVEQLPSAEDIAADRNAEQNENTDSVTEEETADKDPFSEFKN